MKGQNLDEGRKFVDSLGGILQIFVSIFTLSSIAGLVIGLFFSYNYLFKIGYLSIFTDILSQPSVLVAVLMPIFIYYFFYILQLLSPYAFYLNLDSELLEILERNELYKIITISSFTFYIFFTLVILDFATASCALLFFLFCFVLIFIFDYLKVYSIKNINKKNICKYICSKFKSIKVILEIIKNFKSIEISDLINFFASIFTSIFAFIIFSISGIYVVRTFIGDIQGTYAIFPFFILISGQGLMSVFAYDILDSNNNKLPNKSKIIIIISMILFFFIFMMYSLLPYSSTINMLSAPRLIEQPKDASWYLLHNSYGKKFINGMSSSDIAKIKQEFGVNAEGKSEELEELEKNSNALYGYMAWNAGKTKIFCPYSFDNKNKDKDMEKAKKCLVIDASNLQSVPHFYFK